mmetsp:Transcript_19365/g.44900  ORF Transcript_19365/g.44900 Transcript_19365/m.44900 type:complete len:214 (-) Transcript_19365:297-938(-)
MSPATVVVSDVDSILAHNGASFDPPRNLNAPPERTIHVYGDDSTLNAFIFTFTIDSVAVSCRGSDHSRFDCDIGNELVVHHSVDDVIIVQILCPTSVSGLVISFAAGNEKSIVLFLFDKRCSRSTLHGSSNEPLRDVNRKGLDLICCLYYMEACIVRRGDDFRSVPVCYDSIASSQSASAESTGSLQLERPFQTRHGKQCGMGNAKREARAKG